MKLPAFFAPVAKLRFQFIDLTVAVECCLRCVDAIEIAEQIDAIEGKTRVGNIRRGQRVMELSRMGRVHWSCLLIPDYSALRGMMSFASL